ncbi:hypothetical protein H0H81_009986 [Sphagnurus paluster]|uniref:mRNA export factor GLE1 n=1 Tax=Sphagnurus paluster TaxID=117069 RepID=A0A9P7KHY6_9AGAR|nr:hypothetical protein H0H81_009986 [Sphagnurus paluster]
MRFRAPRSVSPSPVRRKQHRQSTFGLQSNFDGSSGSEDDSNASGSESDSSDAESVTSSLSSDSFCYASESEVPRVAPKPTSNIRDAVEQRKIEETVAAIRLRTRHHDPYEDWERQTRMDAFRTARQELNATQSRFHHEQDQSRTQEMERRAALHAQQMKEIEARLEDLRVKQNAEEEKLRIHMKERQNRIWQSIEGVIKVEEEKVKARLEAERRQREEEERKRKEEEEKRKQDEERQKALEEKRKEEERVKEEAAKKAKDEKDQKDKAEAEASEARNDFGMTKAEDDWKAAHDHLMEMKSQTMRSVKADPTGKAEWSKWRRQITAKVGQITDDEKEINKISSQLYQILQPSGKPHHPAIYKALLSSLSKAILLQAETEVTAEKKSAGPLAHVAFNLLETLDGFPQVFFAKLVQRAGGWPAPYMVPPPDIGPGPWQNDDERKRAIDKARRQAMGYRKGDNGADLESPQEYAARISGMMRVYFHILKFPPQVKPLHPLFQLPRYWAWFARVMSDKRLLGTSIAAQLIYTALDTLGSHARTVWGHQWNKMLELVYEGVTTGYGNGKTIGGNSAEGNAARMRIKIEVERILFGP